jgi:hypothetical protein
MQSSPKQSFYVSVVFVAALLGAGLAPAQSLLVSQGQVIAYSGAAGTPDGDVAPGLSMGERFGGSSGPNSGVIDDSGRVLFRAQLVDSAGMPMPTGQDYLSRGYFLGDSRGNLVKVLRGGEPEPSGTIPGATLQTGSGTVALTSSPRMASNGLIMFGANFWDVGGLTVATANDSALYTGTPGSFQILAREGDVAPGCGGATYSTDFGSMAFNSTSINAAGQIVFQSNLAGAGVVTANNAAWFTGSAGNVQLMLRKGDLAPGGEQVSAIGPAAQMNSSGQVLVEITYVVGSGTTPVTSADDKALWIYTPGLGATQVLREGGSTPIPGTTYAAPSITGNSVFNAAGQALVGTGLAGAVTVGVDDQAIFLVSTAGSSLVVRRGDAAPGVAGANFLTPGIFNMCLTDGGTVAFNSTLVGGGVTPANDSGLFTGTPGNFVLVGREGDVAPGSGGQTFGPFAGGGLFLNTAGQVAFANVLSAGAFVQSLYCWDLVLGVQPLFMPNDSLEVQPGVFNTMTQSATIPSSNGEARPLAFANDGTLTFRTSTSTGAFATVKVRIGSLTVVPRKIPAATGGTQNLYLNAGLGHAGQNYLVGGSASGTNPGTQMGAFLIPLNFDWYTDFTLANANVGYFVNTLGTLDANGRALAQIQVPPLPGFGGATVHHAYAVLDAFNNILFVSEAAPLEITP